MALINQQDIERNLQQRLNERMDSVRELIATREQLSTALEAVTEAERADAAAWHKAITAGWSPAELKQSGLTEPKVKPPRVKRSTRVTEREESSDAPGL